MSHDALTPDAPSADESAAPSVEVEAPGSQPEAVDGGSAPSEQLIPVSRFNGLMSKFNSTNDELARVREELEDLRSAMTTEETSVASADVEALQAQVSQLTELLLEERRNGAMKQVFEEYPEAKAFEDLLVGDNPEDIRETAKAIAERIRSLSSPAGEEPAPTTTDEPAAPQVTGAPETPAAPAAPVTGGGSTFEGAAPAQDRVTDAIKNKDFLGWLRAKREGDPTWSGQDEVLSA